jgi:DNA-binding GntR family transcriptional regulator
MIVSDVSRGLLPAGSPLPGTADLAARYKAPVATVEQALAVLVRARIVTPDGWIRSRGRSGRRKE